MIGLIRELGRLEFVKFLFYQANSGSLYMARALFVRPRDFVCFVSGRTKQIFSWLNIRLSQQTTLSKLSFVGQGAAFMALMSAVLTDGHGISPAQTSEPAVQFTAQASFGLIDFTTFSIGLAVVLLVIANLIMWRQRNDQDQAGRELLANPIETNSISNEPEQATSSRAALARSINLERQCQKLAHIADASQRSNIDKELNCRVREERLARICHDLRTPLNAVIGFSDLMRREMFGPLGHDKYLEYVEHIGDSGHNLLNAVDDIFEMTGEQNDAPSVQNNYAPKPLSQPIDDKDLRVFEAEK